VLWFAALRVGSAVIFGVLRAVAGCLLKSLLVGGVDSSPSQGRWFVPTVGRLCAQCGRPCCSVVAAFVVVCRQRAVQFSVARMCVVVLNTCVSDAAVGVPRPAQVLWMSPGVVALGSSHG